MLTWQEQLRHRGVAVLVMIVAAGSLAGAVALRASSLGRPDQERVELMLIGGLAVLVIGAIARVLAPDTTTRRRSAGDGDLAAPSSNGQRRVLEQIATAAPLREVLDAICVLAELGVPGVRAMIHSLDEDGVMLRATSAPSVDPGYVAAMDEVVVGPMAALFGAAAHRHEPVIVSDIATDSRWKGYRQLALDQGFRSCWALPIRSPVGHVVGALALYTSEPREPGPAELLASETATHLAGIAIERSHSEELLRRSEASFRSFVENAPIGIYRVTRTGHLLASNRSLAQLLGYASVDELLHVDMAGTIYVNALDRERIVRELELHGEIYGTDAKWRRQDGTIIQVRISARAHRDVQGSVGFFDGYVEDVTPLELAQQQLRQSEKLAALGQLVSGVAHELNNPLSAILLFADQMLGDDHSPDDREALTLIRDQARRSRAIVRDLLSFVRGRDTTQERVLLADVLAGSARALQPQVLSLGARLDTDFAGLDVYVDTDRTGIEQVITNLVMNAAHAAGLGGVVTLSASVDGSNFRLVVEDSGPGIPPDLSDRIFEPFFTTKPPGEGTGLGLSVTLGIVQHFGGQVSFENRSADAGGGARFIVVLPAGGAAPTSVPVAEPGRSSLGLSPGASSDPVRPRVLIIDDEEPIRTALRRFFLRKGWDVTEATNGATGLETLVGADPPYTAIISDLGMPGCSGIELHDRLARTMPELLSRIIFSTGDAGSRESADFVRRTQCTVLRKPFELRVLDAMLTRIREMATV